MTRDLFLERPARQPMSPALLEQLRFKYLHLIQENQLSLLNMV
jgi:hypothetical protein